MNNKLDVELNFDKSKINRVLLFVFLNIYLQLFRSRSIPLKPSPTLTTVDVQSNSIISPTLTLNIDEQVAQLQLIYRDRTNRLENQHEQLISSIKTEWEQTAKQRIRLQRLTLDYQQEKQRFTEENRRWKKLYNESIQEKPRI